MPEQKKSLSEYELLQKVWERIKKTNPFVRGFIGAIPLLSLIENIIPFERFEVLKAIMAIIISWNEIMLFIGSWIGKIPLVPPIPTWVMNSLTIYSLLFLGNLGYKPALLYGPNKFPFKKYILISGLTFIFYVSLLTKSMSPLAVFAFAFFLLSLVEDFLRGTLRQIITLTWWFMIILLTAYLLSVPSILHGSWIWWSTYVVVIFTITISIIASRPMIKKGLLTSFGAMAMLSLLYSFHLPVVKTFVTEKTETALCSKSLMTDCNEEIK